MVLDKKAWRCPGTVPDASRRAPTFAHSACWIEVDGVDKGRAKARVERGSPPGNGWWLMERKRGRLLVVHLTRVNSAAPPAGRSAADLMKICASAWGVLCNLRQHLFHDTGLRAFLTWVTGGLYCRDMPRSAEGVAVNMKACRRSDALDFHEPRRQDAAMSESNVRRGFAVAGRGDARSVEEVYSVSSIRTFGHIHRDSFKVCVLQMCFTGT